MATVEPEMISAEDRSGEWLVWIGPDDRGLDLEIVAVVEVELVLVIHVMPYVFRRSRS